MGTRKGYPFSRRQYKQGWGILSKSIFGLLGLGACAAKGIKDAVEDNVTINTGSEAPVKIGFWHYALSVMLFLPIAFLSIKIPFIGNIVFIVLFSVFSIVVGDEYTKIKRMGVVKKLFILVSVWIYSFIVVYLIEDYIDIVIILSFVPVLCLVLGYMNGWWKSRIHKKEIEVFHYKYLSDDNMRERNLKQEDMGN
nr:MAG TPA: hypothetical protein [Caudoviricetes sp.]